jgi:enamine deaminase RidA (YjgF/YER057c/UK114 family)
MTRFGIAGALVASGWLAGAIAAQGSKSVKKDFLNPTPGRFSGAVVAYTGGTKLIYVSGQVGRGDDLKTQAVAAYQNVLRQLSAAGAGPEDVIKLNTYIANFTAADRAAYDEAKKQVFPQNDMPASTMVGVQSLVSPQNRIEVEAVAVIKE